MSNNTATARVAVACHFPLETDTVLTTEEEMTEPNLHSRFETTLNSFETTARTVRRGFKVSMAVNVFGVGTLLPNDLPKTLEAHKDK